MSNDNWRVDRKWFVEGMEKLAGRSIEEVKMLTSHLTDDELIRESRVIWLAHYKDILRGKDRRSKQFRALENQWRIYDIEMERRGIDDRGWMKPENYKQLLDEAEALRTPPNPKGSGISAGDLL